MGSRAGIPEDLKRKKCAFYPDLAEDGPSLHLRFSALGAECSLRSISESPDAYYISGDSRLRSLPHLGVATTQVDGRLGEPAMRQRFEFDVS